MFGFGKKGGLFLVKEKRTEEIEFSLSYTSAGVSPPIPFQTLYKVFVKDPDVYAGVLSTTFMVVGPGFYTESDDPVAKEKVDAFCEKVGMDELLRNCVSEMIWAGNSFFYKIRENGRLVDLQHIPITRVTRIFTDESGKPKELEVITKKVFRIPFTDVVHFYFLKQDIEVFGSSLIRPLVEPRVDSSGKPIPAYYQMIWDLEEYMRRTLKKYPPRTLWRFDVSDDVLSEKIEPLIKNLEPGDDIVTNVQNVDVKDVSADPRSRFTEYIEHLHMKKIIAVMSVVHRLFTTPGFTEASAKVAKELQEVIIASIQRQVKRIVEREIFNEIAAGVRLNFGIPKRPEFRYEDIFKAAYAPNVISNPLISRKEARKMLRDMGWPLESESDTEKVIEFYNAKVVDTIADVCIYLVEPSMIDIGTIRYYPVDAEKGVKMAVARVNDVRRPVALLFDKTLYDWDVEKAKKFYNDVFPKILENFREVDE